MYRMPIMNHRSRFAVSAMSDRGFVSVYFLALFLLCTVLAAIAMTNVQNQIRTAINVKRADELAAQEGCVLSYVKCELENEREFAGEHSENGIDFHVSRTGNGLMIHIRNPIAETINVSLCEEDTRVFDYEVIRSEQPA